jgi:hypothetical protein
MGANAGPDFFCIGMHKAGTGWLFDQLQHHPDFWMPPIKELHYFDREFPDGKQERTLELARSSFQKLKKSFVRHDWRPLDERDRDFFSTMENCRGHKPDIERYKTLFQFKNELLTGDVTPGYCALRDDRIEQIAKGLPHLKVILLIRDPVSRAWSQICMLRRRRKFDLRLLEDIDDFRRFLDEPTIQSRSYATRIMSRWSNHFPSSSLQHFFFEDIESRPQEIRADILRYLGADPSKESGRLAPAFNRKSARKKMDMSDFIRQALITHYAEEISECARTFGGHAKSWSSRYGLT